MEHMAQILVSRDLGWKFDYWHVRFKLLLNVLVNVSSECLYLVLLTATSWPTFQKEWEACLEDPKNQIK